MKKLFKSLLLVYAVAVVFVGVNGAAKDDLTAYLSQEHTIGGSTFTLSDSQRIQLERYLNSNVVTDSQIVVFKSKIEEIKSVMNIAKITDPAKLNAVDKNKVINLVKDAGISVGVTVTVNSTNNSVELFDKTGAKLDVFSFNAGKLPFTGTDYITYDIVAVIACMIAMSYILRKKTV